MLAPISQQLAEGQRRGDGDQLRHGQGALPGAAARRRGVPRPWRGRRGDARSRGACRSRWRSRSRSRTRPKPGARRRVPVPVLRMRLDYGKVAVVTGAGAGSAARTRRRWRAAGAVRRRQRSRRAPRRRPRRSPAAARPRVGGDVGRPSAADALVARAVEAFGRLDVMVTNAGVLRDKVLWKMTDEDFDLVVRTHLRGTFTCARAAAIRMREQGEGGRIIVVGSPGGPVRQLRPDQLRGREGRASSPSRGRGRWSSRARRSRSTRSSRPRGRG